jgi:hypothetical protein
VKASIDALAGAILLGASRERGSADLSSFEDL